VSNKNRNRNDAAQAAANESSDAEPADTQPGEFPDSAKVTEIDTGPEWQSAAYGLLNEFRQHGPVLKVLQELSTGMIHPVTGQSMLRNLKHSDHGRIVEVLMPFRADVRVAKFCGVEIQ
jgi:hypothetical protein